MAECSVVNVFGWTDRMGSFLLTQLHFQKYVAERQCQYHRGVFAASCRFISEATFLDLSLEYFLLLGIDFNC